MGSESSCKNFSVCASLIKDWAKEFFDKKEMKIKMKNISFFAISCNNDICSK